MSANRKRLIEFIERSREVLPRLPVVHSTNVFSFDEILEHDRISVHDCKVYKTKLCYFFYGKPTYRIKGRSEAVTRTIGDATVCFLIKPSFELLRLFPFDTGACYGKRYDDYLPDGISIDDFEMPATLEFVAKFVGTFFKTNKNYYDGEISSTSMHELKMNALADVIINLAMAPVLHNLDERCCSCEIQTNINIPLNLDTIENIVIPDRLTEKKEVMDKCARWGIKPILYRFRRAAPRSRTEVVCEKVGDFYERQGYL